MVLFLVLTTWCYGYIDPGTGSYLIQIIIAVIAGAALGIKLSWKKIKGFFANLLAKDNTNNTSSK